MGTIQQNPPPRPQIHLRLIAQVALFSAIISGIALLILISGLIDRHGGSYSEIVSALSQTRGALNSAMTIAGLIIVTLTALLTWLIALYSSFRVAGPIFRFARNLEAAQSGGAILDIRANDALQADSEQLHNAVSNLSQHYADIDAAATVMAKALADEKDPQQSLQQLTEVVQHARL